MSFVGKLAYLVLFPGLAFTLFAGGVARALIAGIARLVSGRKEAGANLFADLRHAPLRVSSEGRAFTALAHAAPAVKLFALAWVSCAVFGFLPDDLPLVFMLLVLAATCDIAVYALVLGDGTKSRDASLALIGWAAPLALIFAAVTLRTGQVGLSGIVAWQAKNGVLPLADGAGLMKASSIVGLLGVLPLAVSMMGLRPVGLEPGERLARSTPISGYSTYVWAFVAPFMVTGLFLAGPGNKWYFIVFWALKVAALVLLFAIVNGVTVRLGARRALAWMTLPAVLAVVSLILAWWGVTP